MMEPTMVDLDEMMVVGMQTLTSSKYNVIPHLWDRIIPRRKEIKNIANDEVGLGISFGMEEIVKDDGEKVHIFYHLGAVPVKNIEHIPEGMTYRKIPAHTYARFTHKGLISKLGDTYKYIYSEWLPGSDYEYDSAGVEIEWYDERFKGRDSESSEFDILIPIKKK